MATLTVHIVDEDDKPISGASVFLSVHHNIMPDTWLKETTDSDGDAEFDFDEFVSVDVSVNGTEEESDISVGQSDKNTTISIQKARKIPRNIALCAVPYRTNWWHGIFCSREDKNMPDENDGGDKIASTTVTTNDDGSKTATATTESGETGEGTSSDGILTDASDSEAVSEAADDAKT